MNTEQMISKINNLIMDQWGNDESELLFSARISEDLAADSLDEVELVMVLEKEFYIEISDEEAEGCKTLGDIYKGVASKLGLYYNPCHEEEKPVLEDKANYTLEETKPTQGFFDKLQELVHNHDFIINKYPYEKGLSVRTPRWEDDLIVMEEEDLDEIISALNTLNKFSQ